MDTHRDVAKAVNDLLRDVIQIHGMGIPYPSELWMNGNAVHLRGVAMFGIGDRGYLTAEYFGYDVPEPLGWLETGFERRDAKLILKDTEVEIPVWWITSSPKARSLHSVPMPLVTAYKCEIQGVLGDTESEMLSVYMTVEGLPDTHLGQTTTRIPEESAADENFKLRGFKRQRRVLIAEASEWRIELMGSGSNDDYHRPIHCVRLTRRDALPFRLLDGIENGIVDALKWFLSFQCGRWIEIPTVVCNPVFGTVEKHLVLQEDEISDDVLCAIRRLREMEGQVPEAMDELNASLQRSCGFEDVSGADILGVRLNGDLATINFGKGDPTIRLAWVGRLSTDGWPSNDARTATDTRAWPNLLKEFWNRYNEPDDHEHLKNCLYHYTESQRVFDDGSIGQALVSAQSTLQALTRWWNGLDMTCRFGPPGPTFRQLLIKAVQLAELGRDSGVIIDEPGLQAKIDQATGFRNDIDHGRAGRLERDWQSVVDCWAHHQNLARLLILAKLGSRDRDARGYIAGPMFLERPI